MTASFQRLCVCVCVCAALGETRPGLVSAIHRRSRQETASLPGPVLCGKEEKKCILVLPTSSMYTSEEEQKHVKLAQRREPECRFCVRSAIPSMAPTRARNRIPYPMEMASWLCMRDRGAPARLAARGRRLSFKRQGQGRSQLSLPISRGRTCMWHACGMRRGKCNQAMNALCEHASAAVGARCENTYTVSIVAVLY